MVGFGSRSDVYAYNTDIQAWGSGSTSTFTFDLNLGPEHPSRFVFLGLVNTSNANIGSISLVSPDPQVDPADLLAITRLNEPVNLRWYTAYFPQGESAELTVTYAAAHAGMGVAAYAAINRNEYAAKQTANAVGSNPGFAQAQIMIPTGGATLALSYFSTSQGAFLSSGVHLSPQAVPQWAVSGEVVDANATTLQLSGAGSKREVQIAGVLTRRNLLSVISVA
jgi:hypothetical protein